MSPIILALNVGSSSLKFALFRCGSRAEGETRLAAGAIERIGVDDRFTDHGAAIAATCAALQQQRQKTRMPHRNER